VVLVRILMSKSGFEDEVLIKLIVGVVKHITIDNNMMRDLRAAILTYLRSEVCQNRIKSLYSNSNSSFFCYYY
jgi:hypothetical protein